MVSISLNRSLKIAVGCWFVMNQPERQRVYLTLTCLLIESRSHV